MEEGGGDIAEWQTFQILSTLVSTEQTLVTQREVAALLRVWIICWPACEFLLSTTHTCPEPGLAPHSQLPQGMSKHKRLGAHDYHSSLLCILSTLYPPLALALTPDCVLGGFLWYLALGQGVGGVGSMAPLAQKHNSTIVVPTPPLEIKNIHSQRGTWNSLGNHSAQHGSSVFALKP